MKKRFPIIWLIIFLSLIMMGLYTLWGYGWHLRVIENLQKENEDLKNKLDASQKIPQPSITEKVVPSSSIKISLPSKNQMQPETTNSGKIKR